MTKNCRVERYPFLRSIHSNNKLVNESRKVKNFQHTQDFKRKNRVMGRWQNRRKMGNVRLKLTHNQVEDKEEKPVL